MRKHISEFASLMDRAGRLRGAVTADATGKRELLEKFPQAGGVFTLVGVDFGVGAFQIDGPSTPGAPCPGPVRNIMSRSYFLINRFK
jgi:hypothetical protein